jgi:hypothetical protein
MVFKSSMILCLAASLLVGLVDASVCASAPYSNFLFLSAFQPAEIFCSAFYPVAPVTSVSTSTAFTTSTVPYLTTTTALSTLVTVQVSTDTTVTTAFTTITTTLVLKKRNPKTTSTKTTSTTSTKPTTTTCNAACSASSALASIEKQGVGFLKTFCSCIETPSTVQVWLLRIMSLKYSNNFSYSQLKHQRAPL